MGKVSLSREIIKRRKKSEWPGSPEEKQAWW